MEEEEGDRPEPTEGGEEVQAEDSTPPPEPVDVVSALNQDLARLMAGQPVPVNIVDFRRTDAMLFDPKTSVNVSYFVMVVLFSEKDEVLLVQESRESCKGTWNLPSSKLNPGETFEEGAKRAVKSEAGLTCELTTLLSLHFGTFRSIRLGFLGKITEGQVKTLLEKDEASLQACFYDLASVFNWMINLRNGDIIPVIHQAVDYRKAMSEAPLYPEVMPALMGHSHIIHRFVLVVEHIEESCLMVLAGCEGGIHVLSCAISPKDTTLQFTVLALLRLAINEKTVSPIIHGVIGVEHNGTEKGKEGLCFTTLVSLGLSYGQEMPSLQSESFMWVPITDEACTKFLHEGMHKRICKFFGKHT